jgi:hypothetical protein
MSGVGPNGVFALEEAVDLNDGAGVTPIHTLAWSCEYI